MGCNLRENAQRLRELFAVKERHTFIPQGNKGGVKVLFFFLDEQVRGPRTGEVFWA